jgi:hypothetical protein
MAARRVVALGLLAGLAGAMPAAAAQTGAVPGAGVTGAGVTGKERLSSKAADQQRVNDCKVPAAKRNGSQRPADCPHLAPRPAAPAS